MVPFPATSQVDGGAGAQCSPCLRRPLAAGLAPLDTPAADGYNTR
jgi:hypothetical protein